jgi:3-methyladenine DNA glycosylase AlkD
MIAGSPLHHSTFAVFALLTAEKWLNKCEELPYSEVESMETLEADVIRKELRGVSDPEKAKDLKRFFKTGPGQYGEGDRFHGVVVPSIRKIVKAHPCAAEKDLLNLLHSAYHEERMAALFILVSQYKRGDEIKKEAIFQLYLANTSYINNWDLVDLTAPSIVGQHLYGRDTSILTELSLSENIWERRIAMLATFYFIQERDSREALRIAELLLRDSHDLIHKAVGWMLREVGKRCSLKEECDFLDIHVDVMPRTMLRYAIERFPEELRLQYLRGKSK